VEIKPFIDSSRESGKGSNLKIQVNENFKCKKKFIKKGWHESHPRRWLKP
jgi:hypothetical protein